MAQSRSVRSVLVITKHHFMGDTIVAVPLLRAARRAYPDAVITLLTGGMAATALEHCPHIDRFVRYAPRKEKGVGPFLKLIQELRGDCGRPDVCLVADRSFRSAAIALCTAGRIRSGFDTEGRGCLLTHPVPYRAEAHEIECCLDVLRAVAPDSPDAPYDPTPELWVTDAERARGAEILRDCEAAGPRLIGIQPGASYRKKQWPTEGFAAVADALVARGAATGVVILGSGEKEAEIAQKMRAAMSPATPITDLTNRTKLRETMGVLTHLSLFLGNDTGVNHIAAALGLRTVGLFGPTPAQKWGNAGARGEVLAGPEGDMSRIESDTVLEAALRLLDTPPTDRPAADSFPPPPISPRPEEVVTATAGSPAR